MDFSSFSYIILLILALFILSAIITLIIVIYVKHFSLSKQFDNFKSSIYAPEIDKIYDCINDIRTKYVPLEQFNDLMVRYIQSKSKIADTFDLSITSISDDMNANMRKILANFNEVQKNINFQHSDLQTLQQDIQKFKQVVKQQFDIYNNGIPKNDTFCLNKNMFFDSIIIGDVIQFDKSDLGIKYIKDQNKLAVVDTSKNNMVITFLTDNIYKKKYIHSNAPTTQKKDHAVSFLSDMTSLDKFMKTEYYTNVSDSSTDNCQLIRY